MCLLYKTGTVFDSYAYVSMIFRTSSHSVDGGALNSVVPGVPCYAQRLYIDVVTVATCVTVLPLITTALTLQPVYDICCLPSAAHASAAYTKTCTIT